MVALKVGSTDLDFRSKYADRNGVPNGLLHRRFRLGERCNSRTAFNSSNVVWPLVVAAEVRDTEHVLIRFDIPNNAQLIFQSVVEILLCWSSAPLN